MKSIAHDTQKRTEKKDQQINIDDKFDTKPKSDRLYPSTLLVFARLQALTWARMMPGNSVWVNIMQRCELS